MYLAQDNPALHAIHNHYKPFLGFQTKTIGRKKRPQHPSRASGHDDWLSLALLGAPIGGSFVNVWPEAPPAETQLDTGKLMATELSN